MTDSNIAPPNAATPVLDRKVKAGAIGGFAAYVILAVLAHFGVDVQHYADLATAAVGIAIPSVQTLLAGIIGTVVAWKVPPADIDIISRLTDALVKQAAADPAVPVSPQMANVPAAPGAGGAVKNG